RISGTSRVESATRAGIGSRPKIGPRMSPRKRSMIVHAEPKTTWKNSSGQKRFATIATTSAAKTTATIGSPRRGTISKSRAGAAAGGAATATSAMARSGAFDDLAGLDALRLAVLRGDPVAGHEAAIIARPTSPPADSRRMRRQPPLKRISSLNSARESHQEHVVVGRDQPEAVSVRPVELPAAGA